jgi:hypothetical protein
MRSLIVGAAVMMCQAQSPASEAALVKVSALDEEGRVRREPGRLAITNFPLKAMVRYAYDVRDIQISGRAFVVQLRPLEYCCDGGARDQRG